MARRKKAWNMSNPLYRYLHGGGKRKARTKARRSTRRSYSMARRHRRFGRRSRGGGGGTIFGLSTRGLVGGLGLLGVGAGLLFNKQIAAMVPVSVPYKDKVVAFALGGPAALVGSFLMDGFGGSTGTPVSGSGAW